MQSKHKLVLLILAAITTFGLTGGLACGGRRATRSDMITLWFGSDLEDLSQPDVRVRFARLYSTIEAARRSPQPALFMLGGDALSPSLLSLLDHGSTVMRLLNRLRPDVMVPGNHEFDLEREYLIRRIAESRFPWVVTNARERNGPFPGTVPYLILEVAGFRVLFYGLVTIHERPVHPSYRELEIRDPVAALAEVAPAISNLHPDLVVVLSHQELAADRRVARHFPRVDVIASGHEHAPRILFQGRTLILKTGNHLGWLGRVTCRIARGSRPSCGAELIPLDERLEIQPEARAWIDAQIEPLVQRLDRVLARVAQPLDARRPLLRTREAAVGDWVADVFRTELHSDAALVNGGGLRWERVFPAGPLTLADLYRLLPFGNRVGVIKLQGADLKRLLEWSLQEPGPENGFFMHVSGIAYAFDAKLPQGKRICGLWRMTPTEKEPLGDREPITVALSSYLYRKARSADLFAGVQRLVDPETGPTEIQLMQRWLERHQVVTPPPGHRIAAGCSESGNERQNTSSQGLTSNKDFMNLLRYISGRK